MTTDDEKLLMALHGISCVPRNVYLYKTFKYDRLADAVRYAEIDARRANDETGKT